MPERHRQLAAQRILRRARCGVEAVEQYVAGTAFGHQCAVCQMGEAGIVQQRQQQRRHAGHPHCPAQGAEQVGGAGSDADVPLFHRVLRTHQRGRELHAGGDTAQQHEYAGEHHRLGRAVGHAENRQWAQQRAAEDHRFVAAGHRGHAPGEIRAHRQAHRQGQQVQGRAVGTGAGHALVTQGHQHGQGNRLETGDKNRAPAQHRAAVGKQVHGQQRLSRPAFVPHKRSQRQQGAGQQPQHLIVMPRMALADFGDAQQQGGQADDHQPRAEVIDDGLALRHRQPHQGAMSHVPGAGAQRQVDQKHPAPRQVLGHIATQHRPGHAGYRVHAAEIALITPTLAGRNDVANDRLAHRDHPAGTDALQHPRQHQLLHALRQAAEQRRQGEHAHADQHHGPAPIQITQLAVDRHRHGHRHHVA